MSRAPALAYGWVLALAAVAATGSGAGSDGGVGAEPGFGADAGVGSERHALPQRQLELTNLHGGDKVTVTFRDERDISAQELVALRHLLRDYRRNQEHDMDFGLFMQLTDLARDCGVPARFEVISGYRSPATNGMLRATGHKVAERSQHMEGHAIDVRLKGCPLDRLHELALAAKRGGVGYYPRSNFVHVDTGRVRSWQE